MYSWLQQFLSGSPTCCVSLTTLGQSSSVSSKFLMNLSLIFFVGINQRKTIYLSSLCPESVALSASTELIGELLLFYLQNNLSFNLLVTMLTCLFRLSLNGSRIVLSLTNIFCQSCVTAANSVNIYKATLYRCLVLSPILLA